MKIKSAVVAVCALMVASVTAGAGSAGAADPGMLRVTTSPAVPSQIVVNGVPRNTWGLDWAKFAPGSYEVCFGDVPGYTTPACQNVSVTSGATTTVNGNFTQRGYLQVETVPATASRISVDGIPRDDWGLFTDVPVGSHQVCFGAVAGRVPPPCQTVNVTAGLTTEVTGTFTDDPSAPGLTGVGMLRVTTNPAVPSQILLDGQIANTWGLNWLEVSPGSHEICFGDVAGFTTPACQNVNVTVGATTNVTGNFGARGYVQVETDPAVASTIAIDGEVRNDWGVYTDLPIGSHEVCFGDVTGYVTPTCQNITVAAETPVHVTGEFVVAGVGTWVELRTPDGTGSWIPHDANRNGLVVGEGYYCTGACTTSGQLQMPPGYTAGDLEYRTVRDNGAIVGYVVDANSQPVVSIIWTSPTASPSVLQAPPGWGPVWPWVISSTGSVIGAGDDPQGETKLLLWSQPTVVPTTVPVPGGWGGAIALEYSDEGEFVGYGVGGGAYHGIYGAPPGYGVQILTDPNGFALGGTARLINNNGLIVGLGHHSTESHAPVAWPSANVAPVVLPMPGGHTIASLVSVEDNGTIVALATPGDGTYRFVVWPSYASAPVLLNQPVGWLPTHYIGMLDDGTIIANGSGPGGNTTAIWTTLGGAPGTLAGLAGHSNIVAQGVSTDGVVYAAATGPGGSNAVLAYTSVGATPMAVTAPSGYEDVSLRVTNFGAPVTGYAWDDDDNLVGLVFVL